MIQSLSYIGIQSPNAEKWLEFGPEVLGLEVAPRGPDGAVRLRNDDAEYRIAIHPGEKDDLAYLGWAVAGAEALRDAITHFEKHGFEVHVGDKPLAALRAVAEVAWFT
ncbi:MAG: VOC family protein, partial [bacterium]